MTIHAGKRFVPLFATLLVLLNAAPAFADTEVARNGLVGQFEVADGVPGQNGVYCRYNVDKHGRLDYIYAAAPSVWARDVSAAEDTQNVGWRVIIKRQKPGQTTLSPFFRSATRRDVATDASPAIFTNEGYGAGTQGYIGSHIFIPREPGAGSQYWVFVRIFWYGSDGKDEGSVTHRLDDYMWLIYHKGDGGVGDGYGDTSCHTHFTPIP